MSDYNSNQRNAQDFLIPEDRTSWFARLVSSLVVPSKIHGVDISHHQGDVDFFALKNSGVEFVILKATEGDSWVDDRFAEYWRKALDAGLLVMTYHFFRSNFGGSVQAKHHNTIIQEFLSASRYETPVIWFDVETEDGATKSQRQNRLLAAHQTAEALGYQSGHYSSPYLWDKLIGDVPWAYNYYGWIAHWTSASSPSLPLGWTKEKTKVWQYGIYPRYSWTNPVEGVSGEVDVDWFYGTREDLEQWLGANPVMECCDELKSEIELLKEQSNQWNTSQDADILSLEQRLNSMDARVEDIEALVQSIKDIFCVE